MAFFKMWKTKHKKLTEDLATLKNPKESEDIKASSLEQETVTFKLKYIGSSIVKKITGEHVSAQAVKSIIKTAKGLKKKQLQNVNLNISIQGITVTDKQENDILKISIYSISNCSTNPRHQQIFSFISTDADETSKCYAFLCSNKKGAQNVTLALANAFSIAYQSWRHISVSNNDIKIAKNMEDKKIVNEEQLIDLDDGMFCAEDWFYAKNNQENWVSFDDDFEDDFFK